MLTFLTVGEITCVYQYSEAKISKCGLYVYGLNKVLFPVFVAKLCILVCSEIASIAYFQIFIVTISLIVGSSLVHVKMYI